MLAWTIDHAFWGSESGQVRFELSMQCASIARGEFFGIKSDGKILRNSSTPDTKLYQLSHIDILDMNQSLQFISFFLQNHRFSMDTKWVLLVRHSSFVHSVLRISILAWSLINFSAWNNKKTFDKNKNYSNFRTDGQSSLQWHVAMRAQAHAPFAKDLGRNLNGHTILLYYTLTRLFMIFVWPGLGLRRRGLARTKCNILTHTQDTRFRSLEPRFE